MEIGQLVKSLAGRDKGRHYLIIGFEGGRALVADGRSRPVNRPKKKNPKHLQPYKSVDREIKERVEENNLNDTVVRNSLHALLAACSSEREDNYPQSLRFSSSRGG